MGQRALVAVLVLVALAFGPTLRDARAVGCDTPGTPTTTVYLPNITKTLGGPSGWVTPFIVQNVGTAVTTLEVSFYRFSDGALVTCRKVTGLAPGTSFADVPNNDADLPDDSQFSVVVRSFGSQVVSVVNEHQGAGSRAESLSYVGPSAGSTTVALPYVAKAVGGWLTTFIIQNLGSGTTTVSATFTSHDGTRTATLTRTVGPGRSAVVDPTVETGLVAGVEYSATLSSAEPIAVVVNAHNDAPSALFPMGFSYNGIPPTAGEVYLPWAGRSADGGRYSRILIQNMGTSDATPTLTFRRIGGNGQAVVTAATPLSPGRVYSFTMPSASDQSCPVGGSSSCPALGEHSIVVSGGLFAVLTSASNQVSALGLSGGPPAAARIYLANITRTLGGASGWTTPVVLQSAGATSATLRWYRFADGGLAATQFVPSLSSGLSVRIDPRSVAGLADDTQYAVVVDAAAPIRAIVLELNALGGDGAMAYEGFAATGAVTGAPVPTSIVLAPVTSSVGVGATQQLTATVADQSGNAIVGVPLAWSIAPSSLGTLSATGLFTAADALGTGTVTATFGTLTASATVKVAAIPGSRATTDRPDDVSGAQIHVVYALPSDGADRRLDTDGTLARSVEAFQRWLDGQTGGRRLRLDTYQGVADISFIRLAENDATIKALDPYIVTNLGTRLRQAGFTASDKVYLVYYDGSSGYSCGGSAWPPDVPGNTVAMYLRGQDPRGGPACDSNAFTSDVTRPGYWEYAMLHDTFHALGAAARCAPHHTLAGHVSDSPRDLMYAGSQPWAIYEGLVLDVGRDDYYGHANGSCLDISKSPYLTAAR